MALAKARTANKVFAKARLTEVIEQLCIYQLLCLYLADVFQIPCLRKYPKRWLQPFLTKTVKYYEKYIRIRTVVIVLPLFTIFLLYLLFAVLLPDFLINENNLIADKGIVKRIYRNGYKKFARNQGYINYPCVDIEVVDRPYTIRLTESVSDKYLTKILDTTNNSKEIEFKYQKQRLNDNLIFNPSKIVIGNKILIPFKKNDTLIGWTIMFAFTLFIFLCSYFSYWTFKTYRQNHYQADKKIALEKNRNILLVWLTS